MKSKNLSFLKKLTLLALFTTCAFTMVNAQDTRLRLGIYGLNHDHISGFFGQMRSGKANVVGVYEPSKALWEKYKKRFKLPDSLYFDDVNKMIKARKPEVMLGYNAVGKHVDIVELCAPLHIPVMVEKPLAATLAQAKRMEALANKYKIKLLVNYETTWYPSFQYIYNIVNQDSIGKIRKMVIRDGHRGPVEIGCSPEFLAWLTDPVLNGAGALNDFGCYGADLATWLMHGQRPIAVTAIAKHYKPSVYPKVEDDATILVEYPTATASIEASWNWALNLKDMEVWGETGVIHAFDGNNVQFKTKEGNFGMVNKPKAIPAPNNDPLVYLTAVLRGQIPGTDDQASLKYNMIAMEILDAAKRSINEGKRIVLQP
ncbi:Gfo/Idh/MocA family protein [Mucilaginibacter sp. UR6-11]|uniref:Gfo/Idh/MocA family protein n=1 Tax=Mucilaginibacter sp. UR6-11 TaxID=1435644 RepID=UPI001E58033E|nr:Gfo/Idh/MocA family oxidoreductase [Mucilaginibacter sp. UR6-11]MCC8425476.1 Gfo/Idh/MocA family oxidoreductase [Mucilaginibacter sp. UR6-11]